MESMECYNVDDMYHGKAKTSSNIAWHRPMSTTFREEEELMQQSSRALATVTDPMEKLRLLCLSHGACGIMRLGRIFRRIHDSNKQLNEDEFVNMLKKTGLEFSEEDAKELFKKFQHNGSICLDEFMIHIRPPMPDARRAKVEQAFNKLDRNGDGVISIDDIRKVYAVTAHPRIFRRIHDSNKQLNEDEFVNMLKKTGLEFSEEDAKELFKKFQHNGSICLDEFMIHIRPPMPDARRAKVEQAFNKLDRNGDGVISIDDIRKVYAVTAHPRYMSGEESTDQIMNKFLANFEQEDIINGKVTREEFMNYYNGVSVSIDNDCYFDLMMRQAYKL